MIEVAAAARHGAVDAQGLFDGSQPLFNFVSVPCPDVGRPRPWERESGGDTLSPKRESLAQPSVEARHRLNRVQECCEHPKFQPGAE